MSIATTVIECEGGVPGENSARCFGKFKKKEDTVAYRKPKKLAKVLLDLFKESQPKLDEYQMREKMSKMIDPVDRGLMFCYAKTGTPTPAGMTTSSRAYKDWEGWQACKEKPWGCNGRLLSVDQIKGWIGSETTKGKKRKANEISDNGVAARAVARGLEN